MPYETINRVQQFNFQINRVLTYGPVACDVQAVKGATASVRTCEDWYEVWMELAAAAEREGRRLHAAYAYRMAEFFLSAEDPRKEPAYEACIRAFTLGFQQELHLNYQTHEVPFEGRFLHSIRIAAPEPKKTVLVCGGYDSFVEEFVLQVCDLVHGGYDVILLEGPGQGRCLGEGLWFRHDFEAAASAALDYFELKQCAMVGISWGGYFALRSAAFESRITAVAAYDAMDNGFEVMTHIFPVPVRQLVRWAYRQEEADWLNRLIGRLRNKSILADWAMAQGMYITGTATPYEFYRALSRHDLTGVTGRITQDVLLLAGEKDHYIPLAQFRRLCGALKNARSLTTRLFTCAEGGEQHCQVGNHLLAVRAIMDWLDTVPQKDATIE